MELFEHKFKESMNSNVPLLNRITHFIIRRKGKQMRPMFVFLVAKMVSNGDFTEKKIYFYYFEDDIIDFPDEEWILTAAHCVDDATSFEVVLGAHNIRDESEENQVRIISTEYIQNEDYDPFNIIDDTALIRLPEKIEFTGLYLLRHFELSFRSCCLTERSQLQTPNRYETVRSKCFMSFLES